MLYKVIVFACKLQGKRANKAKRFVKETLQNDENLQN